MTHGYLISLQCGLFNDSDSMLNTVKKTFLTERSVRPMGEKLLLSSTEKLYSRLAVQKVQATNRKKYTVLYLLTGNSFYSLCICHFGMLNYGLTVVLLLSLESGFLHKVVLVDEGPHIIEEIQIFKQPQTVKNLILSTSKV